MVLEHGWKESYESWHYNNGIIQSKNFELKKFQIRFQNLSMFFDGIGIGFAKKIDIEKKYLIRFQKVLVLEKYWYRYWKSIGISIGKK